MSAELADRSCVAKNNYHTRRGQQWNRASNMAKTVSSKSKLNERARQAAENRCHK